MMISLRTVGSIQTSAFGSNRLVTVTFPAGYGHHATSIVPLLLNGLIILVAVADLIRLSNLGSTAFGNNHLTSVTFLG